MNISLPSLLCLGLLTSASLASSTSSRLDLYAGQRFIHTKSAGAGLLTDEAMILSPEQFVSGQVFTSGISLGGLPQFPTAGDFVITEKSYVRSEADQPAASSPAAATAVSALHRTGTFVVQPLRAGLDGAEGSIRFTFRYHWAQRVRGFDSASLDMGLLMDDGAGGGDAFSRTLHGTGNLASDAGMADWSTVQLPITFGSAFTLDWTLSAAATASSGPNFTAVGSGWAELWNEEVFDASGNRLTRFVDYDWQELTGASNTPRPVATGAMLPPAAPFAAVGRDANGAIVVNFVGQLQQSFDLKTWLSVDPTVIPYYRVSEPRPSRLFFRTIDLQ